jgi:hypothetical protein
MHRIRAAMIDELTKNPFSKTDRARGMEKD